MPPCCSNPAAPANTSSVISDADAPPAAKNSVAPSILRLSPELHHSLSALIPFLAWFFGAWFNASFLLHACSQRLTMSLLLLNL
jgi:hypothetical protein